GVGKGDRRRQPVGAAERGGMVAVQRRLAVRFRRLLGGGGGARRGGDLLLHAGDEILEAGRLIGEGRRLALLVGQRLDRGCPAVAFLLDEELHAGLLLGERGQIGA